MKKFPVIQLILSFVVCGCFLLSATAQTKAPTVNEVLQIVENNKYRIEIDRVYSASVPNTLRFNPSGFIEVNDSLTKVNLPFFGKVYSAPYGDNNGGIKFESVMLDKKIDTNKNRVLLRFKANSKNENFDFLIEFFPGNRAAIRVNSTKRESISYDGTYEALPVKSF